MIFFGFILVDYQTGLWEKYLVTRDWSQSSFFPTPFFPKLYTIYGIYDQTCFHAYKCVIIADVIIHLEIDIFVLKLSFVHTLTYLSCLP